MGNTPPPPPPGVLIMDNLEISFINYSGKASGNATIEMVERFIKTISSNIFGYPAYIQDRPGLSLAVSVPHEDF